MAIFDPPQNPHPLTDHQRIWYRWLSRRPLRLWQIWCKSFDGWLLDKWVKCNEKIFFNYRPYLFSWTHLQVRPVEGFSRWWLKRCGPTQGCAFWGFRWHCSPFLGWNPPKTTILGAWIGVFKPNGQNIESFMLSKLLHRVQPNFAQR